VDEPEQRARHLALAAVRGDPQTLEALDTAAVLARTRGAPAAAAELLELAIGLGGATPERRLRAAEHHFDAGDTERSRRALEALRADLPPGALRARTTSLLGLVRLHDDSFVEAAALLEESLTEVDDDLRLRVDVLLALAHAQLNSGRLAAAHAHVTDATVAADRLGDPRLLSQAEGFRVMLGFVRGDGLDQEALERALTLEDDSSRVRVEFRPSVQAVLLQGWTGQLDAAVEGIRAIRQACLERGEEHDLVYVDFQAGLLELWRGNVGRAAAIADAAWERAQLLDRDVPLAVARSLRGLLAAHRGSLDEARAEAEEALAICRRCGWPTVAMFPMTALARAEVSAGNHHAAVRALEPLLSGGSAVFVAAEIISAPFVPDAVEALVQVGRIDDAEALVASFERNGRRFDRPWALAIGGRGRAMLLAAGGDIDAACSAAGEAMAQHDRLPMPFERARTLLLLGQLQRRRRKKEPAAAALGEAVRIFEQLGAVLWADRARAELARVGPGGNAGSELTPTEQLVAGLAAGGLTNREVASELFISPKTVEANLARIYRKLDIRSRAELGRLMGPTGS
jgi:ATP/maltotriose-dependent transcriptional regulator MalT